MARREHALAVLAVVGAGLAYLFRDKIAQYVSPIRIWTDKAEYRVGEIARVYGSATPPEDIDVYVYQDKTLRAIYTIYLKTLNRNYTGFIPSGFCRNCTLTLQGVGRETGRRSNVVTIRVLG
jgi:hypothetical protein